MPEGLIDSWISCVDHAGSDHSSIYDVELVVSLHLGHDSILVIFSLIRSLHNCEGNELIPNWDSYLISEVFLRLAMTDL